MFLRAQITIFTYFKMLDVPHQAFLAGVHLYVSHWFGPLHGSAAGTRGSQGAPTNNAH